LLKFSTKLSVFTLVIAVAINSVLVKLGTGLFFLNFEESWHFMTTVFDCI